METVFLGTLLVSLVIVLGVDTLEKRRRFLAEQNC